jgi:hypothetical protein
MSRNPDHDFLGKVECGCNRPGAGLIIDRQAAEMAAGAFAVSRLSPGPGWLVLTLYGLCAALLAR